MGWAPPALKLDDDFWPGPGPDGEVASADPVPLAVAPVMVGADASAALPVIAPGPWLPLRVKCRLAAVLLGAWSLGLVTPVVGWLRVISMA